MRALLADDHRLFRAGLATMLRGYGIEVIGEAGDGTEAVARTRELRPDLVLMDIRMPRTNGLEATRTIKAEFPSTKVVMLTVSDEEHDLFEAIKSGAEGYLLKDLTEEEFADMIERISQDEPVMSRGLARKLLDELARLKTESRPAGEDAPLPGDNDAPGAGHELTDREREVLEHVARGRTNKEIGAALYLSEHTINFHVKNILGKLHLANRSQVAAWAAEHGLSSRG